MKILILMCLVLQTANAEQYLFSKEPLSVKITGTIPIAYSSSNPNSKILSSLDKMGHFAIMTDCTGRMAINISASSTAAPADADSHNMYLDKAISPGFVLDNIPVGSSVYLRSDTGSTISGCNTIAWVW